MTGDRLQGKRIDSPFDADGVLCGAWPSPGDYWNDPNVGWCAVTPNGHHIRFTGYMVTAHEDGTITVNPGITFANWDGSLERGIWREA